VQASAFNSAAFNATNKCWIWGDRKYGKFGCDINPFPQLTPSLTYWVQTINDKGEASLK